MSAADPADHRLDHLVVLMFENHSFDSLLGYLYSPAERPQFEGVQRGSLTNPVPPDIADMPPAPVPVHRATSMATPYPDPGEEYPHINTQLFGTVDPASNRFAAVADMTPPFNAPGAAPLPTPGMQGFVTDYVNAFRVQMGHFPKPAEYAQIMGCYTPEQLPVLSGLARGFGCFDHWFCEVPSQTYCNRSFFHAATSSGFVNNGHPPGKFAAKNDAPTIFNRLSDAGRSWRVYYDPAQFLPATGLIHARVLDRYFTTNFRTTQDFYHDAETGQLPDYAFIEPNMFHPHTDMHPHSGARWAEAVGLRPPDTIIGGERLLERVYQSVRLGTSETGSNWRNTALFVTFDEHGGTFDHVPPPAALAPDSIPGEEGFGFDRLGVRVPAILVSAWIDESVTISDLYHSTSVIRSLRDWWNLGPPLTHRDESAPTLLPLLARTQPRDPTTWPTPQSRIPGVGERLEEEILRATESFDLGMERLERDMLGDALAYEAVRSGQPVRADAESVSHKEAHEHFRRIATSMFPQVAVPS
jgi:phospholipase C